MYMPPNTVNTETHTKTESYVDSFLKELQSSFNIVIVDFKIDFLENNQKRATLKEIMKSSCMKKIDKNLITRETER